MLYYPELRKDAEDLFEAKEFEFSEAFFRLFEEAITNSIDEFERNKIVKHISVIINTNENFISISDDGNGYPIKEYDFENEKKWIPEWILTKLYSGTNFHDVNRETIGQNGVGISLVNFFSKKFEITSKNVNSSEYFQIFEEHSQKVYEPKFFKGRKNLSYTHIKFYPDFEKFNLESNILEYYLPLYKEYIRNLSVIYPMIKFTINNEKILFVKKEYYSGIINDDIIFTSKYDFCIGLSKDGQKESYFINSKPITSYIEFENYKVKLFTNIRNELNKKYKMNINRNTWFNENISIVAFFRGINTKFKNQTKDILVSYTSNSNDFSANPNDIDNTTKIFIKNEKFVNTYLEFYSIKETDFAKEKIKKLKNEFVPKLVEAIGKPEDKIMILCEGDSARGAFNTVRNKMIHSLLPLKGKCKNVFNLKLADAIKNKEYANIVSAVHLGNPDNLRHSKIWIASDADNDGYHIRILLILFFVKFFPWFIEQNRLFVLESPKYQYKLNGKIEYSYDGIIPEGSTQIKYFKGLGSLTKDAVKHTINNPKLISIINANEIINDYEIIYGNAEIEDE